jgi:hypothetical protein
MTTYNSGYTNDPNNPNLVNATGTLPAASFPALTGDVTTSAGSVATTIAATSGFLAKPSADLTNVTGDGTEFVIACNTEIRDELGDYDNATYTFTARKTGWHIFTGNVDIYTPGAAQTRFFTFFLVNATKYFANNNNPYVGQASGGDFGLTQSIVVYLTAADTVKWCVAVTGGAKDLEIYAPHTYFGGKYIP